MRSCIDHRILLIMLMTLMLLPSVMAQSIARMPSCITPCTRNLLNTRTEYPNNGRCYCECERTGGIQTLKCCQMNEKFNKNSIDKSTPPCIQKPVFIFADKIGDEVTTFQTNKPKIAKMRPCIDNCTNIELYTRKKYHGSPSCYCDCEQTGRVYRLKCCEGNKVYDTNSVTTASTPCKDQSLLGDNRPGPPRPILLFP